jgi:GNAT superfamily N-acetyltransferase
MEIQPFTHTDLNVISNLQPEGWGDIMPAFVQYCNYPFCHPIKIVIDTTVVGLSSTIIHHDVAWLGHIIVHPEQRGKGIGQLISQTLIDIARQHYCETIFLIATDLGAPVYEKAGFITETEYLFFKDIHVEKDTIQAQNIFPYKEIFKDQVAAIDKFVSAEERMFRLEEYLNNGFVYCNNNIAEGFYLPGFGEGLIIAATAAAGIELMKLHLQTADKLVFPKDNVAALNFLTETGYTPFRSAKRMRLGKSRPVQLQHIYNRIAVNIL